MRRSTSRSTELSGRSPARASIKDPAQSRTTWASWTRRSSAYCQAKSTMNQCWSSTPINLAYSSRSARQGLAVRLSSPCPCCFHNLESSSICQRSREPHQGGLKGQALGRRVGDQDRPRSLPQGLFRDRLLAPLRIGFQVLSPFVSNRLGNPQHQQSPRHLLLCPNAHAQLFHLPHSWRQHPPLQRHRLALLVEELGPHAQARERLPMVPMSLGDLTQAEGAQIRHIQAPLGQLLHGQGTAVIRTAPLRPG